MPTGSHEKGGRRPTYKAAAQPNTRISTTAQRRARSCRRRIAGAPKVNGPSTRPSHVIEASRRQPGHTWAARPHEWHVCSRRNSRPSHVARRQFLRRRVRGRWFRQDELAKINPPRTDSSRRVRFDTPFVKRPTMRPCPLRWGEGGRGPLWPWAYRKFVTSRTGFFCGPGGELGAEFA